MNGALPSDSVLILRKRNTLTGATRLVNSAQTSLAVVAVEELRCAQEPCLAERDAGNSRRIRIPAHLSDRQLRVSSSLPLLPLLLCTTATATPHQNVLHAVQLHMNVPEPAATKSSLSQPDLKFYNILLFPLASPAVGPCAVSDAGNVAKVRRHPPAAL